MISKSTQAEEFSIIVRKSGSNNVARVEDALCSSKNSPRIAAYCAAKKYLGHTWFRLELIDSGVTVDLWNASVQSEEEHRLFSIINHIAAECVLPDGKLEEAVLVARLLNIASLTTIAKNRKYAAVVNAAKGGVK